MSNSTRCYPIHPPPHISALTKDPNLCTGNYNPTLHAYPHTGPRISPQPTYTTSLSPYTASHERGFRPKTPVSRDTPTGAPPTGAETFRGRLYGTLAESAISTCALPRPSHVPLSAVTDAIPAPRVLVLPLRGDECSERACADAIGSVARANLSVSYPAHTQTQTHDAAAAITTYTHTSSSSEHAYTHIHLSLHGDHPRRSYADPAQPCRVTYQQHYHQHRGVPHGQAVFTPVDLVDCTLQPSGVCRSARVFGDAEQADRRCAPHTQVHARRARRAHASDTCGRR